MQDKIKGPRRRNVDLPSEVSDLLNRRGFDIKYFLSNRRYISGNTPEELKSAESEIDLYF